MIDRFGKMFDNFGGEKAENGLSTTGSIVGGSLHFLK
jgi:hypothetical protein